MKTNLDPAPSDPAAERKDDDVVVKLGEAPLIPIDSVIFKDVNVALQAKLGRATLSVEELLALKAGSIVKLDAAIGDLIELRLNQSLIARGEIVAVDDNFGVRIVEIAKLS